MLKSDFASIEESWDKIKNAEKPVYVYGIGDACERILDEFNKRDIICNGIFASDSFVRDKCFRGYKIESVSDIKKRHEDFLIVPAFGSSLPDVMKTIEHLNRSQSVVFTDLQIAGNVSFKKQDFLAKYDEILSVRSLFADDFSKAVFDSVFAFKISGDISFLSSAFSDSFEDLKSLLRPKSTDVYVDLGAYNGDTVLDFLAQTGGECKRIYAFEPDKRSFRKCVNRLIGVKDITFINACAWSYDDELGFSQSAGRQSKITSAGERIGARSVDSVLAGSICDVIKFDVEGAEREALLGAAGTIKEYKPKLMVSAYHRPYDIIDLAALILQLNPKYKLFLRQPPYYPAWDTMIYAV